MKRAYTARTGIAAALICIAATLVAAAGVAQATVPGPNGPIVYQATVGKHVQLFTVRPDGTGVRQLTRFKDSDSVHPSWSPDGSRIAFERDFSTHSGIYTMAVQGGSEIVSLTPRGFQGNPAYSPDGTSIVFDRQMPNGDGLWLMQKDGTGRRHLTQNKRPGDGECRCDESPVFSPDGKRIAFVRAITDQKTAAFLVDADGSGLRQLTPWRLGVSAKLDWSPDGTRILISSPQAERPGRASNVYTIHPDGTGLTQLTHETKPGVHDLADGFSPDGTRIIFAKTVDSSPFQVYVMNADGTAVHRLTTGVDAHWASWGPASR